MAKSEFQSDIRYVSRILLWRVHITSYSIKSKHTAVYQQPGKMLKPFTSIFFLFYSFYLLSLTTV